MWSLSHKLFIDLMHRLKFVFATMKELLFKYLQDATIILLAIKIILHTGVNAANSFDTQGPFFVVEPPSKLEFINSLGSRADCTMRGNPQPSIEWLDQHNNPVSTIPKIRHILGNGSLYFPPFEAELFRQDVHSTTYRCSGTNSVGTIISREITLKAVVNQRYEPEVQDPGGFLGSNVLIKCNIPQFVEEYVTITSWLQEPSFNIFPSLDGDGKYQMLPSGELLIINVTKLDSQRTYRCRTHHSLTQETKVSGNAGRIQLTEMQELVPPIMNTKFVKILTRIDDSLVVPCVAYANPSPKYKWFQRQDNIDSPLKNGRSIIRYGSLIIPSVRVTDSGSYFCTATNSEGSETLEVKITVIFILSAHIQPSRQTVDLGKSADLTCMITGFPQDKIWWLKDGQPLRTGSRVRLLDKSLIKITSITKEDKGMYQCFVKNEYDSTQGIAELRLGEVSPQLIYKFIEQTMQPGPSVSLKCSATGNPTPQITWNLDGFPLPNNDRIMIGQYVTIFGDVISHVNISAVKSEDGGEYECIAKSRAGSAFHSARLNIYGMPYVRPMSHISAVAGKPLHIKCPVAGYPIENIIWEKVPPKVTPFSFARDLNVGDRTSIQCVVVTGDLPLAFTWLKDGSPIVQGSSNSPQKESHGELLTKRINDHRKDQHNYDASGTPLSTLASEHENRISTVNDARITLRQNDEFTSALSITSVTRAQGGTYTCRVQNDAATITHSAQLRVNVPPRISPFNFEDDITEGMRTQLMCSSSQGDQPFNITWKRNGYPIQNRPYNEGQFHKDGNTLFNFGDVYSENDQTITINDYPPYSSILSIHNVTSKHNGNYTCLITNRAGTVEYTTLLSVAVPPRWIIEPQDQSAILGNMVIIQCKAEGFPEPKVQWKQSIGIESYENGTLLIPKVAREHEGYFLCQAGNGIGAGLSKLIKLKVNVGPHVNVFNQNESVRRGNRVTLKCIVRGDQPLDISWRAKGNRIDPSYDIHYHIKNTPIDGGAESELTLVQTSLTDRGEYSCVASNAFGHDHAAIHLQIDEPPNFPRNVHCIELNSQKVIVGWTSNDQDAGTVSSHRSRSQKILSYILQYKEAQESWHEHNKLILPGNTTNAQINNLKPATSYHFRLFAENNLGRSAASEILHVQTDSEVPSGKPQMVMVKPIAPQELLITWRPPERELWHGELLGYAIGYQKQGSPDSSYNYTRIGIPGGDGTNDFRLTGLDKYTQYAVTVSAYNIRGDGPPSDIVYARTLEDTPSVPPQHVSCKSQSAQSINISWLQPPKSFHHGIIQGYKVLFEPANIDIDYGKRETKVTTFLSTLLFNLEPFTNYSIQVLAFTNAGDGVSSHIITCMTDETVPGAPERVKVIPTSETSAIISWLPPRHPNGLLVKYTICIRVLGKDINSGNNKIQHDIPAHNSHFEVRDLSLHEVYETWVIASTRKGPGPKTAAIKLVSSRKVPAAIVSFGQTLSISWRIDITLPCLYVGTPRPSTEWKILTQRPKQMKNKLETNDENALLLRSVQRYHEGNYSCTVRNPLGSDHIVYQLLVQVPPSAPELSVISSTINSISLQWRIDDAGGAPIKGFILQFRREFTDWLEMQIDRRFNSYLFENLQCGTRYQFVLMAFNKIGSGPLSGIATTKTKGDKPVSPRKLHLIRPNTTSILLELASWQDGGCPILYFSIEFKRAGVKSDWIIVSSNVAAQTRYTVGDLEPAMAYNLRITAHNNAGTTITEYYFETLTLSGLMPNAGLDGSDNFTETGKSFLKDPHMFAIFIVVCFTLVLSTVGICFCFKSNSRIIFGRRAFSNATGLDSKDSQISDLNHPTEQNQQQCEQFYATVHKLSAQQSPLDSESGLERIPEYSEDIYPYATFHLPEHENQSSNSGNRGGPRKGIVYESRDSTLGVGSNATTLKILRPTSVTSGNNCGNMSLLSASTSIPSVGTEKRNRRKSKALKSESEEYDSLNSDSDSSERETNAVPAFHTQSPGHLEEPETDFPSRTHSPASKSNKERLCVYTKTPLHTNEHIDSNISLETLTSRPFLNPPLHPLGLRITARPPTVSGKGDQNRALSGSNFSMDTTFDIRKFNPPRKQQQQQFTETSSTTFAAQSKCNNPFISNNYSTNKIERSTAAKLPASNPATSSPFPSAQAQSSQVLKNSNQNPLKCITTKTASPGRQNEFTPSKSLEMQQTSIVLNKSYGNFLTITPRRKGRSSASIFSPGMEKVNAANGLSGADYKHYNLNCNETSELSANSCLFEYKGSQLTVNDQQAMESLCNADTLKLGTESSYRTKYSSHSSVYSLKDISVFEEKRYQYPPDDTIGYANVVNATSPPSAFSDTPQAGLTKSSSHKSVSAKSASISISESNVNTHGSFKRDYTIAV